MRYPNSWKPTNFTCCPSLNNRWLSRCVHPNLTPTSRTFGDKRRMQYVNQLEVISLWVFPVFPASWGSLRVRGPSYNWSYKSLITRLFARYSQGWNPEWLMVKLKCCSLDWLNPFDSHCRTMCQSPMFDWIWQPLEEPPLSGWSLDHFWPFNPHVAQKNTSLAGSRGHFANHFPVIGAAWRYKQRKWGANKTRGK